MLIQVNALFFILVSLFGRLQAQSCMGQVNDFSYFFLCFRQPQWCTKESPDPDLLVPVLFAVRQQNVEQLEDLLLKISDPASSSYGEHLSQADLKKLVFL
jgi:hypothetical protein